MFNLKESHKSLDICELLVTKANREATHEPGSHRLTIQEHIDNLTFDASFVTPPPKSIIVFDDIITSGASFKAAQKIITKNFPSVPAIGLFVARTKNK